MRSLDTPHAPTADGPRQGERPASRLRTRWRASCAIALPCLLAACAGIPALQPIAGGSCEERRVDRLSFGMNSPAGAVSDPEWQAFLADVVTPRFPDGLTVYDAHGQWRGDGGAVDREAARVVEIVHADDAAGRRDIAAIAGEYKRRFRQEAVLVVSTRGLACL